MAEERTRHTDPDASGAEQSKTPGKPPVWRRLLTLRWFVVLLVLTIVVQGGFFTYYQLAARTPAPTPAETEVGLGDFAFRAGQAEKGRIVAAEFSLHIALLPQLDEAAHFCLKTRKFRVQQDIEELLRQAHGADFDDPTLAELKRQLQEQVNETLGIRAIADVIITDLKLTFNDKKPDSPATATAELVPWVDKPSS